MSGGSLNYLRTGLSVGEAGEPWARVHDMREARDALLRLGEVAAAREVEALLALLERSEIQVSVRVEALLDVFHAVEWCMSGDTGPDDLRETLRNREGR